MSRRNCYPSHHESPHEQHMREIVDELVPDDSQKQAYISFARELTVAERRSRSPDNPEFRNQKPECRIAGYTNEVTKRIVQKWFGRGLSGRLMWLIGEAVLGKARIPKLE